jgi:hydrogenase maturation protein HypF
MRARLRIEIRGAVQGVGFRPFVYRLAGGSRLDGWVVNDVGGVVLEVEGSRADLERFLAQPRALALDCFRDGTLASGPGAGG